MNTLTQYKNPELTNVLIDKIKGMVTTPLQFMEICGGHTNAIQKFGIGNLLPKEIRLISGPGCPVCVTDISYIDKALKYTEFKENIITTFGDLLRVPGTQSTLENEKVNHNNVLVIHSPLDVLKIAKVHPHHRIIFLAIGFETTAPGTALLVKKVIEEKVKNVFILSAHKIMPPAMEFLLDDQEIQIDGFIAPGHVSAITGSQMYESVVNNYKKPVVISGFEPADILQTIYYLLKQLNNGEARVINEYSRVVKTEGNAKAKEIIDEVFEKVPIQWRGFGLLNNSGLQLKDRFSDIDIEKVHPVAVESKEPKGCICGDVLKGKNTPADCRLFGNLCKPSNPVGACMVSGEGACQAYYSYSTNE